MFLKLKIFDIVFEFLSKFFFENFSLNSII